jgi:hypothetical protein
MDGQTHLLEGRGDWDALRYRPVRPPGAEPKGPDCRPLPYDTDFNASSRDGSAH